ncbi:two component system response regulator [Dongshaea marina]|uniref:two component system response regulator n=1 Tax=Dongshaea marina TaxID=2047966 RepID=UPI001F2175CA|nr:two component system response regulator [Dongshaea marina]
MKILIVDDHTLIADGIRNFIETYSGESDWSVVGHIDNGLEVYGACQEMSPDLLLTDLGLPGMDGIDVIRRVSKRWPELPILCISAHSEMNKLQGALKAGAKGYILKKSSQQTLLNAIREVSEGRVFVDPEFGVDPTELMNTEDLEESFGLTPREKQILKLISEGKRNNDIADTLNIGVKTVRTHRLNLMRKLGAHNATELVHWALRLGL